MSIYYKNNLIAGNAKQSDKVSFDEIYPIGSIYLSLNADLPTVFEDHGVWVPLNSGRFLLCSKVDGSDVGLLREPGLPCPTIELAGINNYSLMIKAVNGPGDGNNATLFWGNPPTPSAAVKEDTIYGKSDTVLPPALIVRMWMRTA